MRSAHRERTGRRLLRGPAHALGRPLDPALHGLSGLAGAFRQGPRFHVCAGRPRPARSPADADGLAAGELLAQLVRRRSERLARQTPPLRPAGGGGIPGRPRWRRPAPEGAAGRAGTRPPAGPQAPELLPAGPSRAPVPLPIRAARWIPRRRPGLPLLPPPGPLRG